MKYLILIDRKFPYKTGEAFLENEINEISDTRLERFKYLRYNIAN